MVNVMKKKNGWTGFLRQKQYVIAGALVILAVIATTIVYSDYQEEARAKMEAELAQEMNELTENQVAENQSQQEVPAAEASAVIPPEQEEYAVAEEESETAEVEENETGETETEETEMEEETRETVSDDVQTLHFNGENGILWPMEGNVILDYSMDSTVYFPTLDQYKYNPAVIIAGDVNSKVYSVAPGLVLNIDTNEVTGCTVTVDMGDGYTAVYGQLKELNYAVGDYVEAGNVIGYVSEPTKYFAVEGSNLYFELQKDGISIDPIEFFQ
jgi:septal ring factor EnvC (AmiA/AmiB activator)